MNDTGAAWLCAQTRPLLEVQALRHLHNQQFKSFFPFFIQQAKTKRVKRPLFPGYVFVEIPEDRSWAPINSTYGILKVLTRKSGDYTVPQILPIAFMTSLARHIIATDKWLGSEIKPGTKVRITKGALTDQEAIVNWSAQDRVGLLFAIMGREVELEFQTDDLAVV